MVYLCLCGNFHTKPRVPFTQRAKPPSSQVLSVNQQPHSILLVEMVGRDSLYLPARVLPD
jgi:hypothetical protein